VIWFVNNLSYMLRAAKLEKGLYHDHRGGGCICELKIRRMWENRCSRLSKKRRISDGNEKMDF
jgi:hypothetical protein